LDCRFIEGDLRTTNFRNAQDPEGFDLALLLFGELNVFRPQDAHHILDKACHSLRPGGRLVIEAHTADAVRRNGQASPTWFTSESGLFGDRPHTCLIQSFWDEAHHAAIKRYYIIDLASGTVTRYAQSFQAYTNPEYRALLQKAGFTTIEVLPGLVDRPQQADPDFLVLVAQKAASA
jgi:SAM-dependent methyltransferase